ncbi:MAG: hypothetical protein QOI63_606 [Thermoplasmata archaeon]|nr:hypothetical protein [Thermoplasmata archaeon]
MRLTRPLACCLLMALVPALAPPAAAVACELAGPVAGALDFSSGTCATVRVTGDIHVLPGASLSVTGSELRFAGPFHLDVEGALFLESAKLVPATGAVAVLPGHLRLSGDPPLAAGTSVAAGDADAGLPLAPDPAAARPFTQLCYVDADRDGQRDAAELVLLAPACGTVQPGDLRLSPDSQSHPGGAPMAVGQADVGKADLAVAASFAFAGAASTYAAGDPVYLHFNAAQMVVQAGDLPLTGNDAFRPLAAARTDLLGKPLVAAAAQAAAVGCADASRDGACDPGERVVLPLAAGTAAFRVTLAPGATGALRASEVTGAQAVVLRSPAVQVDHLTVSKAAVGVQVEAEAGWPGLTLDHLTVTSSAVGLAATGPATLRLPGVSLTEVATPFKLAPSGSGAPTVLVGAFPGTPSLAGAARLGDLATLTVKVTQSAAWPATVRAIDRDGVVQASAQVDGPTATAVLAAPYQFRTAAGTRPATPYRIAATAGGDAAFADLAFSADATQSLALKGDSDTEAPAWGGSTLEVSGATGQSTLPLSWGAASDDAGGHPNRAVARYEVLVDGAVAGTALRPAAPPAPQVPGFTVTGLAAGLHTVGVRAVDLTGHASAPLAHSVLVDSLLPTITATILGVTPTLDNLYGTPFQLNLTAADTGGSGLASLTTRVNGGPERAVTGDLNFTTDGDYTVAARAVDHAGNTQATTLRLVLDREAPAITTRLAIDAGVGAWSSRPVTLLASATDALSGVARLRFRVDEGAWQPAAASQDLNLTAGTHTLLVEAVDRAGNAAQTSLVAAFDPDAPAIALAAPAADGRNGWLLHAANVTATVTPAKAPVRETRFRVDGGPWGILLGPIHLLASGDHHVEVTATDAAGNTGRLELRVPIALEDPVPPHAVWSPAGAGKLHAGWAGGPPFDAPSGLARIVVEEQAGTSPRTLAEVPLTAAEATVSGLPPGVHQIRVRVEDRAGRWAATPWANLTAPSEGAAVAIVAPRVATGVLSLAPAGVAGLREARYYVDGLLVASLAQAPFAYSWDTRTVRDGPHAVDIVAQDQDGRLHTQSVAYTVRNGYAAQVQDNLLPFTAAVGLSGLACGLAVALRLALRRGVP